MARIGILINELDVGGAEILLLNFLRFAATTKSNEHQFVVYCLQGNGSLSEQILGLGFPVINLNLRWRWDPRAIPKLGKLLRLDQIDLLHTHLPWSGIIGRLTSRYVGLRAVIYTEHSLWLKHNYITRTLNRLTIAMTHKVITVSEAVRRSILENCNDLTERIVTIPNGIDLQVIRSRHVDADSLRQVLGIPTDAYVVGNVARLSPAKGHIYLLDALVQLRRWNPKVCAVMVGRDAGSEAQLKARIRELDLQDNVILTGYRSDAIELMQIFNVFVIPSFFEGMPVALLEAMALGKPVVVTAVGGNLEVVRHSIEGMLVPPGDGEALAEAIKFLINNPEIANSYGYHAQKRVEAEFTLERMVERYLNVYHEVLEGLKDI